MMRKLRRSISFRWILRPLRETIVYRCNGLRRTLRGHVVRAEVKDLQGPQVFILWSASGGGHGNPRFDLYHLNRGTTHYANAKALTPLCHEAGPACQCEHHMCFKDPAFPKNVNRYSMFISWFNTCGDKWNTINNETPPIGVLTPNAIQPISNPCRCGIGWRTVHRTSASRCKNLAIVRPLHR